MVKYTATAIELIFLLSTITLAVLWVRNPAGTYAPPLALFSALFTLLSFIRRTLRSLKLRVFLSVGSTYTDQQELFVSSFEKVLDNHGCRRLVVGRDAPAARQPILQVKDLMKKADAVIVVAFTRHLVNKAIEKPDAKDTTQTKELKDQKYPTVWNQIEAGIAFGLGRPLLIFVEEGLKQEAMLKDRLEFKAIVKPIDPQFLKSEEFNAILVDFFRIARRRSWFRL